MAVLQGLHRVSTPQPRLLHPLRLNRVLVVEQRPHVLPPELVERRLRLVRQRAPHVHLRLTPRTTAHGRLVVVHRQVQRAVRVEHAVQLLLRLTPRPHAHAHALHHAVVVLRLRLTEGDRRVVGHRHVPLARARVGQDVAHAALDAAEQHAVQRRVHEHGGPRRRLLQLRPPALRATRWRVRACVVDCATNSVVGGLSGKSGGRVTDGVIGGGGNGRERHADGLLLVQLVVRHGVQRWEGQDGGGRGDAGGGDERGLRRALHEVRELWNAVRGAVCA